MALRLFWWAVRTALRFRYRVRVTGLEQLRELSGPTLVLPNHPAYIDPPMVLSHLARGFREPLRPLVFTRTYRSPLFYPFMRLIHALEVLDLGEHSQSARQQTLALIADVEAGLRRGESFLIYPSGRLQRQNGEVVGAARVAAELLERCPEANVVLVRTRGLWGSMFSFAQTGRLPQLSRCTLRGLGYVLASLFFFLPRRDVTMAIEVVRRDQLPEPRRETLNPFLEEWYNRGEMETPTFVPYHAWFGRREFHFPELDHRLDIDFSKIAPETRQAVCEMIEEHLGRPLNDEERQPQATLDRIGLDSLDRMDIALQIEQRFGFRSDRVGATVGELWALAEGLLTGSAAEDPPPPEAWWRTPTDGRPPEVLAETIAEAFVRRALADARHVAVADRFFGALTYRRLLVGARLFSKRMKVLPGEAVGVMLPASVAADVVFFALHLAGKLPVMLNWTTGPASLAHAVRLLGVKKIVTSQKFVDRLGVEVEDADYVFLEEVRQGVSKFEALATLLATIVAPGRLLARLPRQQADDPAVVLFTSGSETAPKAVPLTHRNLTTNVRAGCRAMAVTRADVLLGFLPPFHSFGITGNVLAPLLSGLRVFHHADPTDAVGLVRATRQYRPTILMTTPTFLGYMLSTGRPEDFTSVRLVITGAEKCSEAIYDRVAEMIPQAVMSEGYGITECSPVVSVCRPDRPRRGSIGQPLDGVEVLVVDPETHAPLPVGETGMLLVRGPSIFPGYLGESPSPFVEAEGTSWYRTGDLVSLDEEGFIYFRGRLKRFLKAGGEMISLPALEEPFARRYPPDESGPRVAVEGIETPGGRRIVLFTTFDFSLREANALLAEAGFRGVMRLDEVRRIEAIPVLGTGKTDYKVLRSLVAETVEAGT